MATQLPEDTAKNITGHLEVIKVYSNGTKQVVHDDPNMIVKGMGIMLTSLFSGGGSQHLTDHQLRCIQLGVSGSTEASTTQQLGLPLSSVEQYGVDSRLVLADDFKQTVDGAEEDPAGPFILIPQSKITMINDNSIRFTLTIDEDACNGLYGKWAETTPINEIGLFAYNIGGNVTPAPIMVAYKFFSNLTKASDHSLVFRWTINF